MSKTILILLFASIAHAEQVGIASYYSVRSNGGTHTASGERLKDDALTAAHPFHKMGTIVKVQNLNNGKEVNVRINDRGPYATKSGRVARPLRPHPTRVIDVTRGVARQLGFEKSGITKVKVQVVKPAQKASKARPVAEPACKCCKACKRNTLWQKLKSILKFSKS